MKRGSKEKENCVKVTEMRETKQLIMKGFFNFGLWRRIISSSGSSISSKLGFLIEEFNVVDLQCYSSNITKLLRRNYKEKLFLNFSRKRNVKKLWMSFVFSCF